MDHTRSRPCGHVRGPQQLPPSFHPDSVLLTCLRRALPSGVPKPSTVYVAHLLHHTPASLIKIGRASKSATDRVRDQRCRVTRSSCLSPAFVPFGAATQADFRVESLAHRLFAEWHRVPTCDVCGETRVGFVKECFAVDAEVACEAVGWLREWMRLEPYGRDGQLKRHWADVLKKDPFDAWAAGSETPKERSMRWKRLLLVDLAGRVREMEGLEVAGVEVQDGPFDFDVEMLDLAADLEVAWREAAPSSRARRRRSHQPPPRSGGPDVEMLDVSPSPEASRAQTPSPPRGRTAGPLRAQSAVTSAPACRCAPAAPQPIILPSITILAPVAYLFFFCLVKNMAHYLNLSAWTCISAICVMHSFAREAGMICDRAEGLKGWAADVKMPPWVEGAAEMARAVML